jgi:hypothetical protein
MKRKWVRPGLLGFGIGYTLFMGYAEKRGWPEGFTSLYVAFGVAVTLLLRAMLPERGTATTLECFCWSGGPMIAGDVLRYILRREKTQHPYRIR